MIDGQAGRLRPSRLFLSLPAAAIPLLVVGCVGRPAEVSPNEIPVLEERLTREPANADVLLRYSAALFAAQRCDSATVVARRGMQLKPESALGPLVVGQCQEASRDWDRALETYRAYLAEYPDHRGSPTIHAREAMALRERATAQARRALEREAEFAQVAGDPQTLAVLPVDVVGDSTYAPLSRGLAQILTSDLAMLQRFRMVERLQVGALVEEMRLGESGRVDPSTAARMGRMLRAGRMVQGLAAIPPKGATRLEASVVLSTGEVTAPAVQTGRLRDLLNMEKHVVVDLAGQLGYRLSEAELKLILENGTRDLAALLAYSRGLVAEDMGDYSAAALYFAEAVQADPGFEAAREGYEETAVAPEVSQAAPAAVTMLATEPVQQPEAMFQPPLGSVITSTIVDIAATQAEVSAATTTQVTTGTSTTTSQPPATVRVQGTPTTATGSVRIFFRLP